MLHLWLSRNRADPARRRDSNGSGLEYFQDKNGVAQLSSHPSTFFGAAAACLRAFLAMIYVMSFTFLSASIANVGAQSAKLLCKLAVH